MTSLLSWGIFDIEKKIVYATGMSYKPHTMFSTKKIAIFALLGASISFSHADTVECSSQKYFTDNQCQVCQTAGDAATTDTSITLTKQDLSWENTLDGINQNFYETSQSSAEIKTNIATAPTTWDEKGLTWGTDVVWKDLDGLNMFSLDAGKTLTIKTIADKTSVALTSPKQVTDAYFVVKVPISYYELKMGTFKESEKKTVNYCVSYTPKKSTTTTTTNTSTTTNTTTTSTTPKTTTTTTPTTTTATPTTTKPTTTSTTTPSTTTPTSTSTTTPTKTTDDTATPDLNSAGTPPIDASTDTTAETTDTTASKDTTSEDIPAYNAKPKLNSAGSDPTKVATGPAENMAIIIAALLLAVMLFPKLNKVLEGK